MTDPGSLIRIFLRSGVPHVVASKWRVDSQVSAEIMGHLYTRLLQGDSVTAALADSERTIRSNPATAHPYYWGPLRPLAAEGPEEGAWREERWAETPPPAWTSQCRH